MTLAEFAERYPSTVPLETLAIINETTVDGSVEAAAGQARRGRPASPDEPRSHATRRSAPVQIPQARPALACRDK